MEPDSTPSSPAMRSASVSRVDFDAEPSTWHPYFGKVFYNRDIFSGALH